MALSLGGFGMICPGGFFSDTLWLDPRKLVHSGWDDFPIKKGNHHEKNEKDSGVNHPYLA